MKNFNIKKEVQIDNKPIHLLVFAIVFLALLVILVIRLFWIQFVDGAELKEMAYKQITANLTIQPKRGTIYDATGKALAVSSDVDTITINPTLIAVKDDEEATIKLKEQVAQAFSNIFALNYDEVLAKVNSTSSYETIIEKVDSDKVSELKNWMKENDVYSGINIDEDTKRTYPYNNLASNLIGFTGSDSNGLAGIEYYWDSTLTGTIGRFTTSIDATQDTIPDEGEKYIDALDGSNITLSIDVNIQSIVEKYLKQAVSDNNCKNGGSMILMNPSTGDILAMATYPDYNLNTPFTPNESLSAVWDSLSSEEKTNSLYKMYSNKCVNETYEPGSVFKIIMASIALEENITETDIAGDFYCPGYEYVNGVKINCANTSGHGSQSLRNALENSCNPALIQLGQRIGAQTVYKYFSAFGLFERTGIATSGEASSQFHPLESVGNVELATISFGQRFTITPLQMITAACAIANDGVLVKPRIVTKIEDPNTGTVTNVDVEEVRQVISSSTASQVRSMMRSVVVDGGGQSGYVKGYDIGGKTGTSEPDSSNEDAGFVASFLAIAPVENTQVVALLSLYGPQNGSHYGGVIAAPVVAQVLSEVLPYLGIPSSEDNSDSDLITTPDLQNKTVAEAKSILNELGISLITSADDSEIITSQNPKAGVSVSNNGVVIAYTDQHGDSVSTTVPDLKGKSLYQATTALEDANLNVQTTGSGIVVSQDISAGVSVEQGTVVKITLQNVTSELH